MKLDRPIFLVGHARGGSTMLGGVIANHSDVGPKPRGVKEAKNISQVLSLIREQEGHYETAWAMEQKDIWFEYFAGRDVFTTMGKEIIVEKSNLTHSQKEAFIKRLTANFKQNRFFSKSPTNSFRIEVIKELFPDAIIIALYRSAPEVIGSYLSWEKRPNYRKLGALKCITEIGRKWSETICYLEEKRRVYDFLAITYDQLVESPEKTLVKVFNYCDLSIPDYLTDVSILDRRTGWRNVIPVWLRPYLVLLTRRASSQYRKLNKHL